MSKVAYAAGETLVREGTCSPATLPCSSFSPHAPSGQQVSIDIGLDVQYLIGAAQIVERLLEAGASASVTNDVGRTPLHFATKHGNVQVGGSAAHHLGWIFASLFLLIQVDGLRMPACMYGRRATPLVRP